MHFITKLTNAFATPRDQLVFDVNTRAELVSCQRAIHMFWEKILKELCRHRYYVPSGHLLNQEILRKIFGIDVTMR
jgi:hypothetical protein